MPDNALVTRENFIGKAVFSIPKIGSLIKDLRTEKGMILFVVLIIFIIAGGLLLDHNKPKQGHEQE